MWLGGAGGIDLLNHCGRPVQVLLQNAQVFRSREGAWCLAKYKDWGVVAGWRGVKPHDLGCREINAPVRPRDEEGAIGHDWTG